MRDGMTAIQMVVIYADGSVSMKLVWCHVGVRCPL
jgi:hypothetical protein